MLPVLTAAQMRQADRQTIEEIGLPGIVLMENAGAAVASAIRERFGGARRVAVLCGKGNNGGDGFVVARRLIELAPVAYLFGSAGDARGDARQQRAAYEGSGGRVVEVHDEASWAKLRPKAFEGDLIVDALLGTGLAEAPAGLMGSVIADLEALGASPPVVAIDLPSGVPSDGGQVPGSAVCAALTVALAAPKHGHVLPPACDRVGELRIADIGIPRAVLEAAAGSDFGLLEAADASPAFPARRAGAHKGHYGHVLVIAGSPGKSGAAILAALGALRTGAGLVTVATPATALPLVAAGRPEVMTEALPVDGSGGLDREAVNRAVALARTRDVVVLGPGLGQDGGTPEFVRNFVPQCPVPLVLDADGLNAIASGRGGGVSGLDRDAATVLTPHPGEMARLAACTADEVQSARLAAARGLAARWGAFVVLKGHGTIVASPEGRAAVNPTGNPGMATGGTGDVLAGVIGALLARRCPAWLAATAGVFVHGRAGDRAAARFGQESLLAGDLADALPEAIRSLSPPRG
jgi:hydroxyethylthiazole kinase-like uncharacterized protein yjeF